MSNTRRGNKPPGLDFWSKYRCNRHGASGCGRVAKGLARSERRNTSKHIIKEELKDLINYTAIV